MGVKKGGKNLADGLKKAPRKEEEEEEEEEGGLVKVQPLI